MPRLLGRACLSLLVAVPALAQGTDGLPPVVAAPRRSPPPAPGPPEPTRIQRSTRLTVSPLSLLLLGLGAEAEYAFTRHLSLFVGGHLFARGLATDSGAGYTETGGSVDTGARIFPMETDVAPVGFWVGPQAQMEVSSVSGNAVAEAGAAFSLTGVLGYTITSDGGFTASFGAGLGVSYGSTVDTSATPPVTTPPRLGLAAAVHFNLGGAF